MNTLTKDRLSEIAKTLNAEHNELENTLKQSMARAVNIGRLLTEAKELVKHGNWGAWLKNNCSFSERTAQNYMRVYSNYPELAKNATVADLNYKQVLGLLSEPKRAVTFQEAYNVSMDAFSCISEILEVGNYDPHELVQIIDKLTVLQNGWAEFTLRAQREAGKRLTALKGGE